MCQNVRLFYVSNLSVQNFRIFLLMYTGSGDVSCLDGPEQSTAHQTPVSGSGARRAGGGDDGVSGGGGCTAGGGGPVWTGWCQRWTNPGPGCGGATADPVRPQHVLGKTLDGLEAEMNRHTR